MNIFLPQLFDFINLFYGSLDEKMKKFQVYKVTSLNTNHLVSNYFENMMNFFKGANDARRACDGLWNADPQWSQQSTFSYFQN